jgi:uncharacterized protein YbcI
MASVRRLAVSARKPEGGVPSGGRQTETNLGPPSHERNTTAGVPIADGAAPPTARKRQRGPLRGTTDGPAAMAICNAITGALKQSCGKGPTKVKAYSTHDHVAVVVQDMLTTLERTLVQDGHEQLVSEARQVLIGRVAKECRATIEQATGRRVVGWQTEVNPSADRAFTLVQLQPL